MKLVMFKGLPASGKSTSSKLLTATGWKRINKDDLRAMINGGKYTKGNEKDILVIRDNMVRHWLSKGFNVVVDDTNFHLKHETRLREIAKEYGADFEVQFFKEPVDVCVERDLKREDSVGAKVIQDMYNQYLDVRPPVPYIFGRQNAIICDIDGTLANNVGRHSFDLSRVCEDELHQHTYNLIYALDATNSISIFLFSGREDVCLQDTVQWLSNYEVPYDQLVMRKKGDNRKDSIVKREMYEEHVKDKYNVLFVVDDRPQVIRMWKEQGLAVFNADQRIYLTEF